MPRRPSTLDSIFNVVDLHDRWQPGQSMLRTGQRSSHPGDSNYGLRDLRRRILWYRSRVDSGVRLTHGESRFAQQRISMEA